MGDGPWWAGDAYNIIAVDDRTRQGSNPWFPT